MPQPREVKDLAADLLTLYGASWARIVRDERALLNSWTGLRRIERLRRLQQLRATVEALMDRADEHALRFTQDQLPEAYLLGAVAADVGVPGEWAQPDVDAIGALTRDTYSGLLDATQFVRDSTKGLIRTLAREHIADKLIRGQTAIEAGRDLARSLEGRGIAAVVYSDGSRHGLSEYASMLARTKSAEAYTTGTLNQLDSAGIAYVEIFDGAGCGWTSHDDTDKANGTIRTVEEARAYPISHPHCTRAVGGRPDIRSPRDARKARGSATAAQNADQADVALTRQQAALARAQRRRAGSFTDRSTRVSSTAHANVLSRRQATLSRRRTAARPLHPREVEAFRGGSAEAHLVTDARGVTHFTPERQALHDRVINDMLGERTAQAAPEYHLMGGGPASGKSTMMDRVETRDAAIVNADDVKVQLPEYAEQGGEGAAFTHEESSYVAKRAIDEAFSRRIDVTLDGTGDGSVASLEQKIADARAAGYSVHGHYVTVPTDVAIARAASRAARTGRYVPDEVIAGTHARVSQVLPQTLDRFDTLDVYDNTTTLTSILRLDSEGLRILDEELWQDFLDKG